jgi:hypothetical protein
MHTDLTLKILDATTISMGAKFRAFARKTCPNFDTRELRSEMEARKRRELKETRVAKTRSEANRRVKEFNLQTYKYHSLGDYADTIRQFGTSDSYSTEAVSNYYSFYITARR